MISGKEKILDIVREDLRLAAKLDALGIAFDTQVEMSLIQRCASLGLDFNRVLETLNAVDDSDKVYLEIIRKDVDIIIAYLKHSHRAFLRRRLPFISNQLQKICHADHSSEGVFHDLSLIFPDFINDFIHHIHNEEDNLFRYIELLLELEKMDVYATSLYTLKWRSFDLPKYSDTHLDEDEFQGVRELTNNYEIRPEFNIHQKVIMTELRSLDHDLKRHAIIENDILLPRALKLDYKAKSKLNDLALLN